MNDSNESDKKPMSTTPKTPSTASTSLQRGSKVSLPGLHSRLRQTPLQTIDPLTMTNRLALMLDVSGSMSGDRIEALRLAVTEFLNSCTWTDTSIALETFGAGVGTNRVTLTNQHPLLLMTVMGLEACSNTPMGFAMDYVINTYSITRGVLVSDGQPDDEHSVFEAAQAFKEAGVPVDCVHIGNSTSGETVLRQVAEITGGQYIKFSDVKSFAKSFKYLTPAYYAMLTSGSVTAEDLGAKEIK